MSSVSSKVFRLATRGSKLALAQTEIVSRALKSHGIEETEVVIIKTEGDRNQTTPVSQMEGQGWFTTEVGRAVLEGHADAAVHSSKDLPSQPTDGLTVAAYLARDDCRDALVTRDGTDLMTLAPGSRVGTSSARRIALLREMRPDVQAVEMRGNVDTRLRKLDDGEVDALLLAGCGLQRLGLGNRIAELLNPAQFVPAPCQGIIAVEVRQTSADTAMPPSLRSLDDPTSRGCVVAERAVLVALGGGCLLPLGANAEIEGGMMTLRAALAQNGAIKRCEVKGSAESPQELGETAAGLLQ